MNYKSTRNNNLKYSSAEVIVKGISNDGGLFVPEKFPVLNMEQIEHMASGSYIQIAEFVLSKFLSDFTENQIKDCVQNAYGKNNFNSNNIVETVKLTEEVFISELWHGPTCAFKDMALQLLPQLLKVSIEKVMPGKEVIILVATSGDTGKAALEGFKNIEGVKILVFYPENGVSAMQKRQMTTQDGFNVGVCAVKGNFDDAQTGVKNIFTDEAYIEELSVQNKILSSANSINWGRLVPQIIYYFSTYVNLIKNKAIAAGEKINIAVPTGNFGNILSAYYAKKMGLPVNKLICASNINNVLTDFIETGIYDKNREFKATISPSMDILISSNLERLLYDLCGGDDGSIKRWFNELKSTGKYEVDSEIKNKLRENFYGGYCDDSNTKSAIKRIFDKFSYLSDTHTAVAIDVYEKYKKETGDKTKTIITSTASPYKFSSSVLEALTDKAGEDEYENLHIINKISNLNIPPQLSGLKNKPDRFMDSVKKEDMLDIVKEFVK